MAICGPRGNRTDGQCESTSASLCLLPDMCTTTRSYSCNRSTQRPSRLICFWSSLTGTIFSDLELFERPDLRGMGGTPWQPTPLQDTHVLLFSSWLLIGSMVGWRKRRCARWMAVTLFAPTQHQAHGCSRLYRSLWQSTGRLTSARRRAPEGALESPDHRKTQKWSSDGWKAKNEASKV